MEFWQNIPAFCILASLLCAILCSALKAKTASLLTAALNLAAGLGNAAVLWGLALTKSPFVYRMGHYPAPWGNELRIGVLEAAMGMLFSFVLLASSLGGVRRLKFDVGEERRNMFYLLVCLLQASMLSIIYTNDLFTGYVFLEITTLASAGLLMLRDKGRVTAAAVRYMIFNLLGSGLFLLGVILLYDVTGHLLIPNLAVAVAEISGGSEYFPVLAVASGAMLTGLAVKSGLFPFYYWMPDAYSCATPASASIISGLVSKVYILLLVKLSYSILGMELLEKLGILNILFAFGVIEMLAGSLRAVRVSRADRMLAYSSAAQIGYIYMGIGMNSTAGLLAALFHIITHALTKPLLFAALGSLAETRDNNPRFNALLGSAADDPLAAASFDVGALSMVGIPAFAGFASKYLFAAAAVSRGGIMGGLALIALAASTVLNSIYFLRTVLNLHSRSRGSAGTKLPIRSQLGFTVSSALLIAANCALGLHPQPILKLLSRGIEMFI